MMTGGGSNSTYAAGLVAALQAANLTTLATVLGQFPDLAMQLEMGGNATVSAVLSSLISLYVLILYSDASPSFILVISSHLGLRP